MDLMLSFLTCFKHACSTFDKTEQDLSERNGDISKIKNKNKNKTNEQKTETKGLLGFHFLG